MKFLDLTIPVAERNLALDEALLLTAETHSGAEFLRLWELQQHCVVLGKNSRVVDDVFVEHCHDDGVPILRRSSGGGTVFIGPGCLIFTVVLSYQRDFRLREVEWSYQYVLKRMCQSLSVDQKVYQPFGTTDLVLLDRKICGNAQQRKRTCFLHHGCILHAFDLRRIPRYLKPPGRQPAYRANRDHMQFLTNLEVSCAGLRRGIRTTWDAQEQLDVWPESLVTCLTDEKYRQHGWRYRR